jgi:hypothetical protein
MKFIHYLCISITALIGGALFTALHYEWIIIRLPTAKIDVQTSPTHKKTERKKTTLYYWFRDMWHSETSEILFSEDIATTLEHLVQNWLATLEEEQITDKKVILQTAMTTPAGLGYVSFASTPFSSEDPTWKKLMWAEGLLKTIRHNIKGIHQVQFLVNHKQIHDENLDFSSPWPISGWLEKKQ